MVFSVDEFGMSYSFEEFGYVVKFFFFGLFGEDKVFYVGYVFVCESIF